MAVTGQLAAATFAAAAVEAAGKQFERSYDLTRGLKLKSTGNGIDMRQMHVDFTESLLSYGAVSIGLGYASTIGVISLTGMPAATAAGVGAAAGRVGVEISVFSHTQNSLGSSAYRLIDYLYREPVRIME